MRDLTNPKWMYAKATLLLLGGGLASLILLLDHPTPRTAVLLAIAVWCFCRAYYFVFYVIQHYIDPAYRFAGLVDFGRYLFRSKRP
jgi:hypothetical protein